MQNEILEILEPLEVEVGFIYVEGNPKKYITFDIYSISPCDFSEDDNESKLYKIQVDIFSIDDLTDLDNEVQSLMKENGFKLVDEAIMYEKETKLYHKGIRYTKVK